MSWSWKLGRVAGIPIYVHWTFIILLAWIVLGYWFESHDLVRTLEGGGLILGLFGCVVLHELGHALAARRFGVSTSDITLLPIGGVARLERMPEHPKEELIIALAGPAVNVVIVAVLYVVFRVRFPANGSDAFDLVPGQFWSRILQVNAVLAAFNMLPAFPMDGGRVLRALLAMRLPYVQATRAAASIGQAMAILFAFLAYWLGPMIILVALFVWIGAEAEAIQVEERVALKDLSVREAMLTDYHTLRPDDTLGHAADLLVSGSQHDFPVVSGLQGGFVGLLTRSNLIAGLARDGRTALVSDHARNEVPSVEAASSLAEAISRLRADREVRCFQVADQGKTVGLLTLENAGEFLMIRAALAGPENMPAAAGRRLIPTEL